MGLGLFPADFAGPLFQRDDELKIDAVAGQQQEVVMEDGGTVTTLNYVVFELGVLPNDFAVSFQANRPTRAEMYLDMLFIQYRGRRGVAVEPMAWAGIVGGDDLDIVQQISGGEVEADCV